MSSTVDVQDGFFGDFRRNKFVFDILYHGKVPSALH